MKAIVFKSEFMFADAFKLWLSVGMVFGFTYVLSDSLLYSILSIIAMLFAFKLTQGNGIYINENEIIIVKGLAIKNKRKLRLKDLKRVSYQYLFSTSLTKYLLIFYFEENGSTYKYEVFCNYYSEFSCLDKFLDENNISFQEA